MQPDMAMITLIEQRNAQTTDVCRELVWQFERDGFKCCVLKGQANHAYYPEGLEKRRSCGDVDLWVVSKADGSGQTEVRRVLEYVDAHWERTGLCWLHCNLAHESGVPVEVHFHPSFMNEPRRNRRFLRLFANFDECVCRKEIEDGVVIPAMKPECDVIFQMNHIYRHLIDEGVGLRQIVDFYWLLHSMAGSGVNNEKSEKVLRGLGMWRFARALMYVLREVLAMPEEYLLCAASEKDGKFLLSEIMLAGNFGHDDPRMAVLQGREGELAYQVSRAWRRCMRNLRFLGSYPGEVVWEPFVRMAHYLWKLSVEKYNDV